MAEHRNEESRELDVAIVGAGFGGLQVLHRMLKRGGHVRLFEAGSGPGGTWYWNRYPGARVDLESLEYSMSFPEELQQEWEWSERYAGQPELLRYAEHIADRFGLRPHMQFDTRIASATFDERARKWTLVTQQGERIRARHCVMATGLLSAPNRPQIEGADSFLGVQVQTGLWPKEGVELEGKRVCVIGTGSSAVQAIPEIAKVAKHLTVFQRTPVFAIPARNAPMDPAYQKQIKARYSELREKEKEALAGFISLSFIDKPHPDKSALEVSDAERIAEYDRRWAAGGLSFYTAFTDTLMDERSNETMAEYMRARIRERVKNPDLAEKLVPKGYPVLTKRLCADTNYYETYERPNVTLVDLMEAPLERLTPQGVQAGGVVHDCDVIVWATGFDAMTGALARIDIRGRGGRSLKEHWSEGLRTFAGLMSAGFPNMVFINGPGSPSAFWAPIQLAEYQAAWFDRCLDHLDAHGLDCIEVDAAIEDEWVALSDQAAHMTLFPKSKNWYMGDNIPGKPRRMLIWIGGIAAYRDACEEAAANGYQKFRLSGAREPVAA